MTTGRTVAIQAPAGGEFATVELAVAPAWAHVPAAIAS